MEATGTPRQCAVSRCAASCRQTRSRDCCFAVGSVSALNHSMGRKRIPGATEPMARMAMGMPAIR
eukprot:1237413-Prymnesium_polylepis.3